MRKEGDRERMEAAFEHENKEQLSGARVEAFGAMQEWAKDAEPVFAVEALMKYHGPASEWLKEKMGSLDYETIVEMSDAQDWERQRSQDLDRSRLAGEVRRYIEQIVTPLVLIKEKGPSITPDKVELFGKWLATMMAGVHQDEISNMIDAAKRHVPDLVISSDRSYFAGEDQPDEMHRTEEGTGPLLAAGLDLRLGDAATVSIYDDEQYGHNPPSIGAYMNE